MGLAPNLLSLDDKYYDWVWWLKFKYKIYIYT
jgi:hypothetical protein